MPVNYSFLDNFISLFFPRLCLACEQNIPTHKEIICTSCKYYIPKTNFHLQQENPFTERFWGRLELQSGTALYHFIKGGRTQYLIHNLKYKGQQQVGVKLGNLFGMLLRDSPYFKAIDVIVPVPLHPRKKHKRGFNQSDAFAKGLSETLLRPWSKKVLKRTIYTKTQTAKSRLDRLKNVMDVFSVDKPYSIEGKHVLLVDDVLTTGATLEACGLKLLEVPGVKLSMATIAIASD